MAQGKNYPSKKEKEGNRKECDQGKRNMAR